jgi:hypothetical protein
MELILGLLSPIIAAILAYSVIRDFKFTKLLALLFFGIITLYLSITTFGPEGPFYRLYVCVVASILFLIEIITLIFNPSKRKDKAKLFYLFSLLVIILLLFFSNGVCC